LEASGVEAAQGHSCGKQGAVIDPVKPLLMNFYGKILLIVIDPFIAKRVTACGKKAGKNKGDMYQ
jgi:hypothetical protein